MATVYHNTTHLTGVELKQRLERAEGQLEQFHELYKIFSNMTKWEARRKYIEYYGPIDEIQPGARIDTLVEKGIIYKSTEKWIEERGAFNFVYKLMPLDGSTPDDFNNKKLKFYVEVVFNEDGTPNELETLANFYSKFETIEKKYK